jgi:ERCC4-type nuclease
VKDERGGELIYLTTAANDRDLVKQFHETEAVVAPIPYGDAVVEGLSDDGHVSICGERKKPLDLIQCINSGRHIRQVRDAYEHKFKHYFLVVEGILKQGSDGEVEYRTGTNWTRTGMPWTRYQSYINQLHYLMGVNVLYSTGVRGTAEIIRSIHDFFQTIDHSSLKQFHSPNPSLLSNPSLLRRVAKELPGIGWERSLLVESHWTSIRDMVNATPEEWTQIDGIGKGISKRIDEVLQ